MVILSGVNDSVHHALNKAGVCRLVGEENVCNHIDKALARAAEVSKTLQTER